MRARLALTLAAVAGCVDAVGVLTLAGLFTAHMSGNTARLGVALGAGDLARAAPPAAAIALFVGWIMAGAVLAEAVERRAGAWRERALLLCEALLLAGLMVAGALLGRDDRVHAHGGAFYVLAALAIGAMGIQASVLSRVGDQPVRTTYISGLLTNLAQHTVARLLHGDRSAGRRAALLAGIALSYLTGATVGGVLEPRWALWSVAVPAVVLVAAAAAYAPER